MKNNILSTDKIDLKIIITANKYLLECVIDNIKYNDSFNRDLPITDIKKLFLSKIDKPNIYNFVNKVKLV